MLIFGARRLLSLKNCQKCPKTVLQGFLWKYLLFFLKKLNIHHLISDLKGYIHFWCKMNLTGRTVTQRPCCKQSKPPSTLTSTVRNITLLSHFLPPKFFKLNNEEEPHVAKGLSACHFDFYNSGSTKWGRLATDPLLGVPDRKHRDIPQRSEMWAAWYPQFWHMRSTDARKRKIGTKNKTPVLGVLF